MIKKIDLKIVGDFRQMNLFHILTEELVQGVKVMVIQFTAALR